MNEKNESLNKQKTYKFPLTLFEFHYLKKKKTLPLNEIIYINKPNMVCGT